ncbi:unnamed protein product [Auanema sp. JU1783]|nr:unnamed protein product [Auanema sp. JU1783]
MWWLLLVLIFPNFVSSNTECLWAAGRIVCNRDQALVKDTVIEIWDKDGPEKIGAVDILDPDDMAGLSVVDNEDGLFRVEGCASDIDWLGPFHRNRPEFYLKIRHRCLSPDFTEMTVKPPVNTYAPVTMDYFIDHPIVLDP